jgi:hypothetical protein
MADSNLKYDRIAELHSLGQWAQRPVYSLRL